MGVRPGDRVAETLRELPVERLAEVPAHHVDAEGERQARVALPGLAEVEDLHEPELTVGDLSLMNQQAHVCLSFKNSLRNLIERDLDQRRVADVETEQQGRRRVLARDRDDALGQLARVDGLARDEDRAIALPHRGARVHHPVLVGDQEVRREGHSRDLELRRARPAVERFDVLQDVLDRDAGDRHLARRERVEHERVVGVGAVAYADDAHTEVSPCSPGQRSAGANPSRKSPARTARMIASRSRGASTSIHARAKCADQCASSVAIFTSGISPDA